MINLCSMLSSCLKKPKQRPEPLIKSQYGDIKFEDKQSIYKLYEMPCKCNLTCQHISCDLAPILKIKNDRIEQLENIIYMKDSVILQLNNRIQYDANNLNLYSENYQLLLAENKFLRDDNEFLSNSKLYSKRRNERFKNSLSVVSENSLL